MECRLKVNKNIWKNLQIVMNRAEGASLSRLSPLVNPINLNQIKSHLKVANKLNNLNRTLNRHRARTIANAATEITRRSGSPRMKMVSQLELLPKRLRRKELALRKRLEPRVPKSLWLMRQEVAEDLEEVIVLRQLHTISQEK